MDLPLALNSLQMVFRRIQHLIQAYHYCKPFGPRMLKVRQILDLAHEMQS